MLAIGGVGGLLGALLAARAGALLGQGRTVLVARVLTAVAWLVVAVAPELAGWSIVVVSAGQFLYGYSIGVEDPNEMAYCQAVTPGALLGRMSATMRSANRSMAVVGALLGGALGSAIGLRETILVALAVFAAAAAVLVCSPMRDARI